MGSTIKFFYQEKIKKLEKGIDR